MRSPFRLTPEILLKAYQAGIFPMAESADDPELFWVDPEWRGILPLDGFHLPRRLRRVVELMRRAEADGLTILLSHALQYENATVLEVEVSAPDQVRFEWSDLELEVVGGGQRTRHWGAHGGGDRTQIRFIAWPPLPDDLSGVAFRLAAAASPPPEPPLLRLSTPVVLGPTGGAAPLAP